MGSAQVVLRRGLRALRRGAASVGPVLALVALAMLPAAAWGLPRRLDRAWGVVYDVAGLAVLLWALQFLARGWGRRGPGWRTVLVSGLWALGTTFELFRAASRFATNEDLPVYDLLLLARHLWVLGRDVLGGPAADGVALLCAIAPLLLWGLAFGLFSGVEAAGRRLGPRRSLVGIVGIAVVCGLASQLRASRWVGPDLIANATESAQLWWSVRRDLATRPHRAIEDVRLEKRPDVLIYIVESYGDVVRTTDLGARWSIALEDFDDAVASGGWTVVSGRSEAPVHGGRSWIADASLLSGLHVARQATYEHVVAMADRIPHLPRYFRDQGYETVLVRPKDRERPGVKHANHFRFDRTVFFDDLRYTGPIVGWGHVPDQYTVEFVHEHVLSRAERPVFAFFHLATSHMPWGLPPPVLHPYTAWLEAEGTEEPVFLEREAWSEARMRMSRFKSRSRGRKIRAASDDPEAYLDLVLYDFEVLAERLASGPDGDQLIIVMGDHQPPVVASGLSADVPVHVLGSDPRMVRGFLDAGFVYGVEPIGVGPAELEHRDLFAVIVGALVGWSRAE